MQNTLAKTQVCSTNGFLHKVRLKFATQTLNLQRHFPKSAPRHQKLCKNKEQERFFLLALFVFVGFGQLAVLQVVSSAVELGQQFHTTVFPKCKFLFKFNTLFVTFNLQNLAVRSCYLVFNTKTAFAIFQQTFKFWQSLVSAC